MRSISIKLPGICVAAMLALALWGSVQLFTITKDAALYYPTKEKLDYYLGQFEEMKSTIDSLQMAEMQFKKLFTLESQEEVLDNLNETDVGSLDMEVLKRQINKTIDSVGEIRDYLSLQRDLYRATPMGFPVKGYIASDYGRRIHPITGKRDFHTGIDISDKPGTPVVVTADGIVSFSGRSGANGNLVAIEHGFGYSTYYAHNKKNNVVVGQIVKRGDVISYLGSTGSSTGPHVHYEVWKDGKSENPRRFLKGGNW